MSDVVGYAVLAALLFAWPLVVARVLARVWPDRHRSPREAIRRDYLTGLRWASIGLLAGTVLRWILAQ